MRRPHAVLVVLAVLAAAGTAPASAAPPVRVASLADQPLGSFQRGLGDDRGIRLGSIGSGIFRAPGDPEGEFYFVSDRGPNGQPNERRTFPVPDFTPSIVRARVIGDRLEILERIPLRTASGVPVTGLPNLAAVSSPVSPTPPAPDEVPYNFDASALLATYDRDGLDTEDIVRTRSGEFWLVDEYRPSLVRVAADGTVLAGTFPEVWPASWPAPVLRSSKHCPPRMRTGG